LLANPISLLKFFRAGSDAPAIELKASIFNADFPNDLRVISKEPSRRKNSEELETVKFAKPKTSQ